MRASRVMIVDKHRRNRYLLPANRPLLVLQSTLFYRHHVFRGEKRTEGPPNAVDVPGRAICAQWGSRGLSSQIKAWS